MTTVKIKRESVLNALLLFSFIAVLVYTGYTTYLVSFIHLFGFALVRCPLGEGALEAFIGVLIIIVMGWYVIKWIGRTYID